MMTGEWLELGGNVCTNGLCKAEFIHIVDEIVVVVVHCDVLIVVKCQNPMDILKTTPRLLGGLRIEGWTIFTFWNTHECNRHQAALIIFSFDALRFIPLLRIVWDGPRLETF
jgi:hypothetical protein